MAVLVRSGSWLIGKLFAKRPAAGNGAHVEQADDIEELSSLAVALIEKDLTKISSLNLFGLNDIANPGNDVAVEKARRLEKRLTSPVFRAQFFHSLDEKLLSLQKSTQVRHTEGEIEGALTLLIAMLRSDNVAQDALSNGTAAFVFPSVLSKTASAKPVEATDLEAAMASSLLRYGARTNSSTRPSLRP